MSFYFPNVDYTYIFKREGTEDDPFINLIDTANVSSGAITLREIPSFNNKVVVKNSDGNKLAQSESDTLGNDEFRVDYSVGNVHFNDSRNGEQITIEYLGMGWMFISASRVVMVGEEGDPLESLQEMLEYAQEGVETLERVGSLDFKGEYSDTHAYKKWNFITYKNKTYVSVKDGEGNLPTDTEYWRLVSSGIGVSGVYVEEKIYGIGEVVSDLENKNLYVSLIDNNSDELGNEDAWQLVISLDGVANELSNLVSEKIDSLDSLENELVENDSQRDLNDDERDALVTNAIASIKLIEEEVEDEESKRVESENKRKSEELLRKESESSRISNESQRKSQEDSRDNQEKTREQEFASLKNNLDNKISELSNLSDELDSVILNTEKSHEEIEATLGETNQKLEEVDGYEFMGEYNPLQEYKKNNLVQDVGKKNVYIATQDSIDIPLDDESHWSVFVKTGERDSIKIDDSSPNEDGEFFLEEIGYVKEGALEDFRKVMELDIKKDVGDLSNLKTARKDNVVDAINELKTRIDDLIDIID